MADIAAQSMHPGLVPWAGSAPFSHSRVFVAGAHLAPELCKYHLVLRIKSLGRQDGNVAVLPVEPS